MPKGEETVVGIERELKFNLASGAGAALSGHALLRLAERLPPRRLQSWYFDTPERALAGVAVVLRLRDDGQGRVVTVKTAPADALGSERGEWEWAALDSPACDRLGPRDLGRALRQTPLGRRLEAEPRDLLGRLAPSLGTDFRRSAWHLTWRASRLEVAFDQGACLALREGQVLRAPLGELEIEVLQGDLADAWDAAWALAQDLPLLLSPVPKAQRAAALLAGGLPEALPEPGALQRGATARQAQAQWLQTGCAQLAVWGERVVRGGQARDVHQLRVVLRRLRTALRWLAPRLPPGAAVWLRGELRWAHQLAGLARDHDVALQWLGQVQPEAARSEALRWQRRLRKTGAVARQALVGYLGSPRFGRLLLALARCAQAGLPGDAGPAELRRLSRRALLGDARQWRAALRDCAPLLRPEIDAGRIDERQTAQLHALRIASKRLRLSAERFGALLDGRRCHDALASRRCATALQTHLGDWHDLDGLARRVAGGRGGGAQALREGLVERASAALREAVAALRAPADAGRA